MSIRDITSRLQEWRRYRATMRELARLSDRELADLGVNRAEIAVISRKAVFG